MLSPLPAVAYPYFFHACVVAKVVDVPVWSGRSMHVMVHSGTDASRTERAADIKVVTTLGGMMPKPSNANLAIRVRREKQCIGAGGRTQEAAYIFTSGHLQE